MWFRQPPIPSSPILPQRAVSGEDSEWIEWQMDRGEYKPTRTSIVPSASASTSLHSLYLLRFIYLQHTSPKPSWLFLVRILSFRLIHRSWWSLYPYLYLHILVCHPPSTTVYTRRLSLQHRKVALKMRFSFITLAVAYIAMSTIVGAGIPPESHP